MSEIVGAFARAERSSDQTKTVADGERTRRTCHGVLACLIRFGDGLAPSEPPTDDVGSNYCVPTPGTVSRGFQFCEILRKFQCIGAVQF
jgi:hypothetical protein